MKRILALLLALLIVGCVLTACGEDQSQSNGLPNADASDPVNNLTAERSADKYRSYYQVWIGSFCDSNDDEIGDIPGLISKLDYINDGDPNAGSDIGCDGIWLSPMMPSSTYHKYNIEDYYDIDPEFGTLEDFDELIKECHERGIVVIIDLVLNHSGAGHEFFIKACEELREGNENGYARYYNFSKKQDGVYQYNVPGTDYYYQADFWDQMPDWNLSYEGTRDYFEDVTKFWLERGVDGFRLDAVKYFEDSHTDGEEFLTWFYEMAQGYNPDVYMVGEDWDDAGAIYDMYDTGIDSLFNFKFAGNGGEYVLASHGYVQDYVKTLKKYDSNIHEHNENAINANFLTNHDMVRVADLIETDDNKFAAALYLLTPGNSFTYYGEEIGMEAMDTNSGDAYYRMAMVWDNDNLPSIYANGVGHVNECPLGGVEQQLPERDSLLNTYRKLIRIRMQNPEIARGQITEVVDLGDPYCAGYIIDDDGSRILIVLNGMKEETTVSIDTVSNPELRGWVIAQESTEGLSVKLDGSDLTLPAMTVAVIKENK